MAGVHEAAGVREHRAICAMGVDRKYPTVICCFIFIPQAYHLQYFKAKTKMILPIEAKTRLIFLNPFTKNLMREYSGIA